MEQHLRLRHFFEVKTYTACNSRYNHNHTARGPADRRARLVSQEYSRKFKKLDKEFAPEVVEVDNDGTSGPFQTAQQRFYRGQVIPLCSGWFGEIGEDFGKVIKQLAREAAAGDGGMTVSLLVNTDRKGGAYSIMLQQFRRAIGVAIARGNAEHKLTRLHYVRATAEEARATCNSHHSRNRWRPGGTSSWYS